MDNNDLERIVKNAHRLRLLDARGCARISDSGLVRLPAWDLEHLYISGELFFAFLIIWFHFQFHSFTRFFCYEIESRRTRTHFQKMAPQFQGN